MVWENHLENVINNSHLNKEMKLKIPDLNKIIKPIWKHEAGYGLKQGKFYKQSVAEQGTAPEDQKLLDKLGIKKKEKVLAIAGYYGSWASEIKRLGAKVDYNDISRSMVNYVKKNQRKFDKYICSNYELIPKKSGEYDWTFTFEACGGKQGLPIAYLRSLLNKKGGILVLYFRDEEKYKMGGKLKSFSAIVKIISSTYYTSFSIKKKLIKARRKNIFKGNLPHMIYILRTNKSARNKAFLDLKVLDYLKKKRMINSDVDSKNLKIKEKELKDSIKRLSRISKLIDEKFNKTIELK